MSLLAHNTTCDIYRFNNAPPAAPDVAGVSIMLQGDFATGHAAAISTASIYRWTHIAMLAPTVDIRDAYLGGTTAGEGTAPNWQDTLYVPDKNGTAFRVVFVERMGRGTGGDVLKVYLQRGQPTWPTSNL